MVKGDTVKWKVEVVSDGIKTEFETSVDGDKCIKVTRGDSYIWLDKTDLTSLIDLATAFQMIC